MNIKIIAADPRGPEASELLGALSTELSARYEGAHDGAFGFRPEQLMEAGCAFLIGSVNGQAVACGGFKPRAGDTAEVKRMYVAPAYRGRGYSKAMLTALEDGARACGYRNVWLETGERQPEAIRLYESMSYRQTGSEPTVTFEKSLVTGPV